MRSFLTGYHLKDWIKNDKSVGAAAEKVEEFIDNNKELSLCADICNSIKHLKRTKSDRSHKDPTFGGREFSLSLGGAPEPIIKVKFSIETKTGTIDAFELASECVRKWG